MKRVPSFSARPGFPNGLQVLLVEADKRTRDKVAKQLSQLSYVGICCSSPAEAIQALGNRPNPLDVVLAEAGAVAEQSPAFVTALNGLPLVLMSEGGSATEVLKSIELGAVEYIEKPLSLLKLRNIWQHVVRKMMQGPEQQDSMMIDKETNTTPTFVCEDLPAMPVSPSTPSNLSSGVDHGFTIVDDSLRSFKLCETFSSSSHSDPSDLILPDLTASADSDSKPYSFPTVDTITAPPTKKTRRSSKDSTSNTLAAPYMANRPPLAIRPAPPSYPMVQSPMMNLGSNQWGYQAHPGYVWGTPLANSSAMDSSCAWQGQHMSGNAMPSGGLMRCQSAAADYALPSLLSDSSCSTELDSSLSLTLRSASPGLEGLPTDGSLFQSDSICSESQTTNAPPIGLQLRKSESFLDLINEHLQSGTSALPS